MLSDIWFVQFLLFWMFCNFFFHPFLSVDFYGRVKIDRKAVFRFWTEKA